jgi:Domain of unknown function DUF11
MKLVSLVALVPLFAASVAAAATAPDLTTEILPPPLTDVYATGRYNVKVSNIGNRIASAASVTITLPATHTSPQVYVMGTVGAKSAGCTASGTTLVCTLGSIPKKVGSTPGSVTVFFDIALPQSDAPIDFGATAAVTSGTPDSNPANNAAAPVTAAVNYLTVVGYPPAANLARATSTNRHCTGQGLTAFFECTKFPSSISSHDADFIGDGTGTQGTIEFAFPGYRGFWSLSGPGNSHLSFVYEEDDGLGGWAPVAAFEGDGVRSTATTHCYEGLTEFMPTSPYVAPYEVCF